MNLKMASLGQQLKQAREERGITIHQIADATHIGARFLQAIESDDYGILPGGVFNRAFVRKFARQVGFDEEQAVRLYEEQLTEMGGEPIRTSYLGIEDAESKSSSGNGLLLSFIAILVLGAVLYAAYIAFTPSSAGSGSDPNAATPIPQATDTPVEVTPTPETSPSPTPEIAANELRINVNANLDACWISYRIDGGKNETATLAQGESREFLATEKITFIRFGNLPALNITINGRKVNLDKLAPNRTGVVVDNVLISKDNYQQFLD